MSEEKFKKPEDRLTLKVAGQDKELFMSAGLVRKVASIVNELEDMAHIYLTPAVQERCAVQVLVERDERGRPKEDVDSLDLMAFEMTTEDAAKLFKWIGDHVMHFFIEGATNMETNLKDQMSVLQNLAQSLNGTVDSIQKKP